MAFDSSIFLALRKADARFFKVELWRVTESEGWSKATALRAYSSTMSSSSAIPTRFRMTTLIAPISISRP